MSNEEDSQLIVFPKKYKQLILFLHNLLISPFSRSSPLFLSACEIPQFCKRQNIWAMSKWKGNLSTVIYLCMTVALNYFITCSLVHVTVDTTLILLVFSMLHSFGSDNMGGFWKEAVCSLRLLRKVSYYLCCKLGEGNHGRRLLGIMKEITL